MSCACHTDGVITWSLQDILQTSAVADGSTQLNQQVMLQRHTAASLSGKSWRTWTWKQIGRTTRGILLVHVWILAAEASRGQKHPRPPDPRQHRASLYQSSHLHHHLTVLCICLQSKSRRLIYDTPWRNELIKLIICTLQGDCPPTPTRRLSALQIWFLQHWASDRSKTPRRSQSVCLVRVVWWCCWLCSTTPPLC